MYLQLHVISPNNLSLIPNHLLPLIPCLVVQKITSLNQKVYNKLALIILSLTLLNQHVFPKLCNILNGMKLCLLNLRLFFEMVPGISYILAFFFFTKFGGLKIVSIKHNLDGSISKYEARLFTKNFHQCTGLGFYDTFSLVVKPITICLVLSVALSNGQPFCQ